MSSQREEKYVCLEVSEVFPLAEYAELLQSLKPARSYLNEHLCPQTLTWLNKLLLLLLLLLLLGVRRASQWNKSSSITCNSERGNSIIISGCLVSYSFVLNSGDFSLHWINFRWVSNWLSIFVKQLVSNQLDTIWDCRQTAKLQLLVFIPAICLRGI